MTTTETVTLIQNRRWFKRASPFPHVLARDVFMPDFYRSLESEVQSYLGRGLKEHTALGHLSRMDGYDAYGLALPHRTDLPTSVFFSRFWREMIGSLFDIERTPYVFVGIHYHPPGSKSGFLHNDFNPTWFPRTAGDLAQVPDNSRCSYKSGEGPLPPEEKVQVARGAAMIFFLGNSHWRLGKGGEVGLFSDADAMVDKPDSCVPPINNSLVIFECTPRSFHSFLSNSGAARTSIIMWIHRSLEEATHLYGTDQLEVWKQ
jgi:hypothetical protein